MKRREFLSSSLTQLGAAGALWGLGGAGAALGAGRSARSNNARNPGRGPTRPVHGYYRDTPKKEVDESDPNIFVFARLKFRTVGQGEGWRSFHEADENLLGFLRRFTNLPISNKLFNDRVVDVADQKAMFTHPFLFMTSERDFRLTQQEKQNLAEHFRRGGFLYADDCVIDKGMVNLFFKSFLREFDDILPETELRPVPVDHAIYHCAHDFPNRAPRPKKFPETDMGLFYKERLVAFATTTDIHCAWWFDRLKDYRESCLKMAQNIIVYALTH